MPEDLKPVGLHLDITGVAVAVYVTGPELVVNLMIPEKQNTSFFEKVTVRSGAFKA